MNVPFDHGHPFLQTLVVDGVCRHSPVGRLAQLMRSSHGLMNRCQIICMT